ncbi:hypothetical protein AB4Z46_27615 [Variovorax sp. M-6]|uniref:hypothetical protein n=1 Tax=Variovorax sp. M-6 TaxID=3233041 RepID=UPI003F946169
MSQRLMVLSCCLVGVVLQAHAAGGHHAVDDAAILGPGQCQLETWVDRETGGARSALHLGPACRVGPVELGLNGDRTRTAEDGLIVFGGPQIKWAYPLNESWSTGVVFSATWRSRAPGFVGSSFVIPVTWQAGETVSVNANIGRDFLRGDTDAARSGLSLEWSPLSTWSFVAERFREFEADYWRAGTRWMPHPAFSIDLSLARGLGPLEPAWWSLGLTWVFDR